MKIGIALSGGGVRGIAHLGILKVFEEIGVKPNMLTGTSAGSIVGAFYAYGYSPDEILDVIKKTKLFKILRPSFSWKGLLTLEKAHDFFSQLLPTDSFESLKIPFYVCATNVKNGKQAFFSKGELIKPVMASSAIPVIFLPVQIGENQFIDGGVVNNLPVEPLIGHCDKIIGVHCNPVDEDFEAENMKGLLERTFIITISRNVALRKNNCDLFLEPYELRKFSALDFSSLQEIFDIGYKYAKAEIKQIERVVESSK